jgi:ABC-type spermidine/putrescine transport system permease subunit II
MGTGQPSGVSNVLQEGSMAIDLWSVLGVSPWVGTTMAAAALAFAALIALRMFRRQGRAEETVRFSLRDEG